MNNLTPIRINGYDTFFTEASDDIGKYLLIHIPPNADKDISEIHDTIVNGHLIQQIDYLKVDGKVSFIKAYYLD